MPKAERPRADIDPGLWHEGTGGQKGLAGKAKFNFGSGTVNIGAGTASLVLVFDPDKKRIFQGPVVEDMTVLEALNSSAIGGGFEIKYWVAGNGDVNLAAIGGETSNGVDRWRFYLNRQPVWAGDIGRIIIRKHDLIEARFE